MPVQQKDGKWFWGSKGPFETKEKAEEVERAAYANGYAADSIAMDKSSVRSYDVDGRLRVEKTPISKSNICPYYGREIPDFESLGLDANKVYNLFRDPEELRKAAHTFNNIPLLNTHIPVNADNPQKENVVGATGSNSVFDGEYLNNGLIVWDSSSIAGVESGEQRELSSAYRYRADMTPGEYNGEHYDGVMRDIIGNHVALVEKGRAGKDVLVYDHLPKGLEMKPQKKKLAVLVKRFAMDMKIDVDELKELVEDLPGAVEEITEEEIVGDEMDGAAICELLKNQGIPDDVLAKISAALGAGASDEELEDKEVVKEKEKEVEKEKEKDDKPAMDAATVTANVRAEFKAIREAEIAVKPLVGEIDSLAMDSAEAIYRFALDSLGVKHKGVHSSALPALIDMAKTKTESKAPTKLGMDSASSKSFETMFPNASKLKRG